MSSAGVVGFLLLCVFKHGMICRPQRPRNPADRDRKGRWDLRRVPDRFSYCEKDTLRRPRGGGGTSHSFPEMGRIAEIYSTFVAIYRKVDHIWTLRTGKTEYRGHGANLEQPAPNLFANLSPRPSCLPILLMMRETREGRAKERRRAPFVVNRHR